MKTFYLYGISNGNTRVDELNGIEGRGVEVLSQYPLHVYYSDISGVVVEPELMHLKQHNQVLLNIMNNHSVLPFAFGTVIENEMEVKKFIEKHRQQVEELLGVIEGKVEVGIKVFTDLKKDDDQLTNRSSGKIYLMSRFSQYKREQEDIQKIQDDLKEAFIEFEKKCFKYKTSMMKKNILIFDYIYLIKREDFEFFKKTISELILPEKYIVKFSGPWPPYNFTNIEERGEVQ